MAVEGISNIIQNLANQFFAQTPDNQQGGNTPGTGSAGSPAIAEDTFTPSTQTDPAQSAAQDAGIFQVSQGELTAVTANILLGQPASNVNQNGAPAQDSAATTANTVATQTDATANSNGIAKAAQQASGNPTGQASSGPASQANVQVQLQALNAALPALGLSNAQIQQIDRIASLIQDFNPAAFTSLVNQFEAQAQQAAQQSAGNAPANTTLGTGAAPTAAANTSGGNFQVQEVLIHLTGSQGTSNGGAGNPGGQGAGANNTQSAPANLQIQQVQFTFTNGNGQTFQVQTLLQNTGAGTANPQAPPRQVAAA